MHGNLADSRRLKDQKSASDRITLPARKKGSPPGQGSCRLRGLGGNLSLLLLLGGFTNACDPAADSPATEILDLDAQGASRAETLIGTPVLEPTWPTEVRARLEKDLEVALAVMAVAPEREDSHIWVGRRLGYLSRNEEAIGIFTAGIHQFPQSYKLYRFRGRHRARSRDFEGAISDYRMALDLMEGIEDSYEPDGAPNAQNRFLGSYRSNLHYYLGQTQWATGDFSSMIEQMEISALGPLVQHPDRRVATTYWRYLGLRKLGRDAEAATLVSQIPLDLELLENHPYYDGIKVFQGTLSAEGLPGGGQAVSRFAVAMELVFDGRVPRALELLNEIVRGAPNGFWPAEAEILRLDPTLGERGS